MEFSFYTHWTRASLTDFLHHLDRECSAIQAYASILDNWHLVETDYDVFIMNLDKMRVAIAYNLKFLRDGTPAFRLRSDVRRGARKISEASTLVAVLSDLQKREQRRRGSD